MKIKNVALITEMHFGIKITKTKTEIITLSIYRKKHLQDVYTNIPDERYFSQFNTSSR